MTRLILTTTLGLTLGATLWTTDTNPLILTLIGVLTLVTAMTAFAWRDWHTRPERYGRRPRTRHTDTRRPVRHWPRRGTYVIPHREPVDVDPDDFQPETRR